MNFDEKWRKKANFRRKRNLNELPTNFRDHYCFNIFEISVIVGERPLEKSLDFTLRVSNFHANFR